MSYFGMGALPVTTATNYPSLTILFGAIGALCAARFLIRWGTVLLQTFVIPGESLKKYGAKKGAWTVVTGATDGIGREFALQLAKAGFNIFLASRSPEKLSVVAAEIEAQYHVQTRTHAIDFANASGSAWESLAEALSPIDVGVLVNNVGRSHSCPVDFVDTPQEEMHDILQINIISTLKVTSIILPGLLARKRGLILNLGSFAGAVPSPMLATYSGSKAFLSTWSQALGKEVESRGVRVQLVNASFVVSNMSKIRRQSIGVPTPKLYVRTALSKIGVPAGALGKPYTSTPYWVHSLTDAFINWVNWPSIFIAYTLNLHIDIRKRALRKKEREAVAAKKE